MLSHGFGDTRSADAIDNTCARIVAFDEFPYWNAPHYPQSWGNLGFTAPRSLKPGGAKNPSQLTLTLEAAWTATGTKDMPCCYIDCEKDSYLDPRHQKGFNASFVDGSVRKMEIPNDMTYGRGAGNRHDPFFQKYCYRNFTYKE